MRVDPDQLSVNHRIALRALSQGTWCGNFKPRSASMAVNALWRFGLAERCVDGGVFYRITDAGRKALDALDIKKEGQTDA